MSKRRFGIHGGQYIPETLMNAVQELEEAYNHYKQDPEFNRELTQLFNEYAGRPSRLYYAARMTEDLVELGIPFSDPAAEGPVIQAANVRSRITTDIGAMIELIKQEKEIPCAVGFGISTPEQAKAMAAKADGVIVGSAIVRLCGKYGSDCVEHVKAYVKEMKDVLRGE